MRFAFYLWSSMSPVWNNGVHYVTVGKGNMCDKIKTGFLRFRILIICVTFVYYNTFLIELTCHLTYLIISMSIDLFLKLPFRVKSYSSIIQQQAIYCSICPFTSHILTAILQFKHSYPFNDSMLAHGRVYSITYFNLQLAPAI